MPDTATESLSHGARSKIFGELYPWDTVIAKNCLVIRTASYPPDSPDGYKSHEKRLIGKRRSLMEN